MPSPRACYWPRAPNAASMPKYYLWHNDLVGRLFLDAMLQAADRGVRVRLLIDDMTLGNNKDIGMVALDAHANVEVRVFNPFTRKDARWLQILTRFDDVTRRMHNKSFTVDNQVSIIGGRNIGNEYFEADPSLAFGDLDVLSIGPVVGEVSTSFDLYWNSSISYPISTLVGSNESAEKLDAAKIAGRQPHRRFGADHPLQVHRHSRATIPDSPRSLHPHPARLRGKGYSVRTASGAGRGDHAGRSSKSGGRRTRRGITCG